MTHTFNTSGHEQFEVTDASTSYIVKYSITIPGTGTITSGHTCLASRNALTSCIRTAVTTLQDAKATTAYTGGELDWPLVLGQYLIAGSIITPWEHRRSTEAADSETLSTKPATTNKPKSILTCGYC
jgi:hypothetical protein